MSSDLQGRPGFFITAEQFAAVSGRLASVSTHWTPEDASGILGGILNEEGVELIHLPTAPGEGMEATLREETAKRVVEGAYHRLQAGRCLTIHEGICGAVSAMMDATSPEWSRLVERAEEIIRQELFILVQFHPAEGWGFTSMEQAKHFAECASTEVAHMYNRMDDGAGDKNPATTIIVDTFTVARSGHPVQLGRETFTTHGGDVPKVGEASDKWQEESI